MIKTYHGSCHCGTIQYEADLDLAAGTFKCNCEMCTKCRMWGAIAKPSAVRVTKGEAELVDYHPNFIHHLSCPQCRVKTFGVGDNPDLGGKFYAICVSTLDDVDVDELMAGPITICDGRNNRFDCVPTETRHL